MNLGGMERSSNCMNNAACRPSVPAPGWAQRIHQCVLIASLLPLCWLVTLAVHEAGHVLGAGMTGAQVVYVELHPLRISRTDVLQNRHPLFVAWAGPVLGCTLPLAAWGLARRLRMRGEFALRFLSGFCLVGNGGYLAAGSWDRVGDAGVLLDAGCPHAALWAFGAVTVAAGFRLWHGTGNHFGWGDAAGTVDRRVAWTTLLLLLVMSTVEWLWWSGMAERVVD